MNPALAMAAARACGSVRVSADGLNELRGSAERIGRRVGELGGREVVVGWADGYGPALDDPALAIYELPQTRLVALAIVLALCYSPEQGQRRGREMNLDAFLDAAARLRPAGPATGAIGHAHMKGALADLHEIGLVELGDDVVRIGPSLAAWTPAEWSALDILHGQLLVAVE